MTDTNNKSAQTVADLLKNSLGGKPVDAESMDMPDAAMIEETLARFTVDHEAAKWGDMIEGTHTKAAVVSMAAAIMASSNINLTVDEVVKEETLTPDKVLDRKAQLVSAFFGSLCALVDPKFAGGGNFKNSNGTPQIIANQVNECAQRLAIAVGVFHPLVQVIAASIFLNVCKEKLKESGVSTTELKSGDPDTAMFAVMFPPNPKPETNAK